MKNNKIQIIILISYILLPICLINNPIVKAEQQNEAERIIETSYLQEWIDNPNFTDPISEKWCFTNQGDNTDLISSNSGQEVDFTVIGEENIFSLNENSPNEGWQVEENPDFPTFPDLYENTTDGFLVSHLWSEGADQSPSVHWSKNISMPVNMSDYIITSASIEGKINATVKAEGDNPGLGEYGLEVPGDSVEGGTQNATYDYARFYISISDCDKNKTYEIASYQTIDLGKDTDGEFAYLADTLMDNVSEDALIFYLTSILEENQFNFTITMGMRLWCEDNWNSDDDEFTELYLRSIYLNFTYLKKIDRSTSITLNQIGKKINDGTGEVRIDNASLNFLYKSDVEWPADLSPNSEIRILINDNSLNETLKLIYASQNYAKARPNSGFDIASLIQPDSNISLGIQILIADNFELDSNVTISIDSVTLKIGYTVIIRETIPFYIPEQVLYAIIAAAIVMSAMMYIIVRQNIVEPRKRRLKDALEIKTQVIDDATNLRGIFTIHKKTGKVLHELAEAKYQGNEKFIADFLKSIIQFSSNVVDNAIPPTVEFNFDEFSVLAADGDQVRTAIILYHHASDRLNHAAKNYTDQFEADFRQELKYSSSGDAKKFNTATKTVEQIFRISLLDNFTFSTDINIRVLEKRLGKKGKKLIKIATETFYVKKFFKLDDIISKIPPQEQLEAKSFILDLISYGLLIPYDEKEQDFDIKHETLTSNQPLIQTSRWMETLKKVADKDYGDKEEGTLIRSYKESKKKIDKSTPPEKIASKDQKSKSIQKSSPKQIKKAQIKQESIKIESKKSKTPVKSSKYDVPSKIENVKEMIDKVPEKKTTSKSIEKKEETQTQEEPEIKKKKQHKKSGKQKKIAKQKGKQKKKQKKKK